jgi:hypothetical protein
MKSLEAPEPGSEVFVDGLWRRLYVDHRSGISWHGEHPEHLPGGAFRGFGMRELAHKCEDRLPVILLGGVKIMPKTNIRVFRGLVVAGAVVASAAGAPAAFAGTHASGDTTYNNATVKITGGNAAALSACVNYAKAKIKQGKAAQNNFCQNLAVADGGSVELKNTNVLILQTGTGSGKTVNNATVSISGGDAVALAACVNFLQGTSSASQKNACANTAIASGGNVTLKNSNITVVQG